MTSRRPEARRDVTAERLLERHALTWRLDLIDPATIDWAATRARQTRDTLVDPDLVDRYRANLAAGDQFPPAIAIPTVDGRHELLAGAHRAHAHEAEDVPLPAYVLTSPIDDLTAYLVAIEDNATHGQPLTNDERARHALRLIDELGLARDEAARRVGLSKHLVERTVHVRDFDRRASKFGLHTGRIKALPATAKWRLQQSTARRPDAVFIEAVQTVRTIAATAEECVELASTISNAGDDAAVFQAIEDFEIGHHDDRTGTGTRPGGRRPAHAARDAARAFLDIDPDDLVASVLPADRAITVELIARLGARAAHVAQRLTALQQGVGG